MHLVWRSPHFIMAFRTSRSLVRGRGQVEEGGSHQGNHEVGRPPHQVRPVRGWLCGKKLLKRFFSKMYTLVVRERFRFLRERTSYIGNIGIFPWKNIGKWDCNDMWNLTFLMYFFPDVSWYLDILVVIATKLVFCNESLLVHSHFLETGGQWWSKCRHEQFQKMLSFYSRSFNQLWTCFSA